MKTSLIATCSFEWSGKREVELDHQVIGFCRCSIPVWIMAYVTWYQKGSAICKDIQASNVLYECCSNLVIISFYCAAADLLWMIQELGFPSITWSCFAPTVHTGKQFLHAGKEIQLWLVKAFIKSQQTIFTPQVEGFSSA